MDRGEAVHALRILLKAWQIVFADTYEPRLMMRAARVCLTGWWSI